MKSIGVYLGAHCGNSSMFSESVTILGKEIAALGLTLIYGGSSLGLMGILATTVKNNGGKVVGVITNQLIDKEKPLSTLDELHIVDSMQERKQLIQQRSDMFIVMPGGLGTLEEAFDTWNAIKIGIFNKPLGFLNIAGYFDELFAFISTSNKSGFISNEQLKIPYINTSVNLLLKNLNDVISLENLTSVTA